MAAPETIQLGSSGGQLGGGQLLEDAPTREISKSPLERKLDTVTNIGVMLSTFAFIGLQIPQIWKNATGDPHQMKSLSWAGYISGSMGNLLLATYFTGINEWAQVVVQMIGAITNYIVATQVFMAGYFPPAQFWTLFGIIVIGLLMPGMYICRCLPESGFATWKEATTPIGFAALCFSITATFTTDSWVLLGVAIAGLIVGSGLLLLKGPVPSLAPLTAKLGGWLATFLFMWMPLPQITLLLGSCDQCGAPAAEAFSMGFTVLATFGNGLGSTRAWVIKEKVWFTGSYFGLMVGGWATAIAVHVVLPSKCSLPVLIAYTIFLLAWFSGVVFVNGKAKGQGLCQQGDFMCRTN